MNVRRLWNFNPVLRLSAIFGAVGFLLPFLVYASCLWAPTFHFLEYHSAALFLICPPYILSIAFDHMAAPERMKTVTFVMAPANGVIYFVAGLALALILKSLRSLQEEDDGIKNKPRA